MLIFRDEPTGAGIKGSGLFPAVAVSVASQCRLEIRRNIDIFSAFKIRIHQRFLVMRLGDEHVKRRDNEEREDRADRHSADEHETDGISRRGARAGDEGQGKVTGDGRDSGHQDRAQTDPRGFRNGVKLWPGPAR